MHDRTAATYILHYWAGRHAIQLYCGTHPPETDSSPSLLVGLSAIGEGLKARYAALASPVPPHLVALVKQVDAHLQLRPGGHGRSVMEAECCFDFQKDDRHLAHIPL